MKMKPRTPTGIKNSGFTMAVTMIAPNIFNMICDASNIAFCVTKSKMENGTASTGIKTGICQRTGKNSSVAPISLENRFKIRPDGFVSKNRIDVEIMPLNMKSCSFCDARTQMV